MYASRQLVFLTAYHFAAFLAPPCFRPVFKPDVFDPRRPITSIANKHHVRHRQRSFVFDNTASLVLL
jgi:hypothetical protein